MRIFSYHPPSGLPVVIWQDDYYLAINKPSGLLSNPGRAEVTHDCALTRLQKAYGEIHLVHRLDCDTSGILVFAKTKKAEGALKKSFQERQVKKTYVALVEGKPTNSAGIISAKLAPNPNDRPLQMVNKDGKDAVTEYEVTETAENHSRVTLYPHTGRTHQLRVHLKHIGHTILGDEFYGDETVQAAAERLCLHAKSLRFKHFVTGQMIQLDQAEDF